MLMHAPSPRNLGRPAGVISSHSSTSALPSSVCLPSVQIQQLRCSKHLTSTRRNTCNRHIHSTRTLASAHGNGHSTLSTEDSHSHSTSSSGVHQQKQANTSSSDSNPQQSQDQLNRNKRLLESTFPIPSGIVSTMVQQQPTLLHLEDLEGWLEFFQSYGLGEVQLRGLLRHSPQALASSSPYIAGNVMLFFKRWGGFTNAELSSRVITIYPTTLRTQPESLQALVTLFTEELGFDEAAFRRVLRTSPAIVCDEHRAKLIPLLRRIRASTKDKYVNSGSYHI